MSSHDRWNTGKVGSGLKKIKNVVVGCILLIIAIWLLFVQSQLSHLWTNILQAGIITVSFYLIYDGRRDEFKRRTELIRKVFNLKVVYQEDLNTFTYTCLDKKITREQFVELVVVTYETSSRNANRFVKHFEEESQGN